MHSIFRLLNCSKAWVYYICRSSVLVVETRGTLSLLNRLICSISHQVHDKIVEMPELNDHQKSAILEKLAVSIRN